MLVVVKSDELGLAKVEAVLEVMLIHRVEMLEAVTRPPTVVLTEDWIVVCDEVGMVFEMLELVMLEEATFVVF